jgi:hypothetical protein
MKKEIDFSETITQNGRKVVIIHYKDGTSATITKDPLYR